MEVLEWRGTEFELDGHTLKKFESVKLQEPDIVQSCWITIPVREIWNNYIRRRGFHILVYAERTPGFFSHLSGNHKVNIN